MYADLESIVAEFSDTPAPLPASSRATEAPALDFDAETGTTATSRIMGMTASWQHLHPSAPSDAALLDPLFPSAFPIRTPWCAPSIAAPLTNDNVNDDMEKQEKWGHCRAPSELEGYGEEGKKDDLFDIVCPVCFNTDLYNRRTNPEGTLEMLPGGAYLSRRTFICKKNQCMCTWSQRMSPRDEFSDKYNADDKHITLSNKKEVSKPPGASQDRTRLPVTCPVSIGGCNRAFVVNEKNQTIYRLGGAGSTGARNAFLCRPDKGGCGVRWSQRIYFADGEHEDADPRIARSKAKAPWEKEKKVNGRMPPKKKQKGTGVSHLPTPEYVAISPGGCCAGCNTVLPLDDKTHVATQCSICYKWYCDNEDGYHYCSSTMTYDPAHSYQPVCVACNTAALQ